MKIKLLTHTPNTEKIVAMSGDIFTIDINDASVHNAKDLQVEIDENDCWNVISHKLDSGGYGQYRGERTHVFSYKKFIGEIKNEQVVRHKCDNPRCCNPNHLEIGTQKDNAWDRENRNRGNHYTKLTSEQVIEIAKSKMSERKLAKIYNISHGTINDIKNKRIWKDLLQDIEVNTSKKLTKEEVLQIYYSDEDFLKLQNKYDISKTTIYDIKNKRRYKSILKEEK